MDEDGDGSKTAKLVFKLMEPYLDKGHELYMDNFYNSVDLSKKLLFHKTHTIGTLRKNRKGDPKTMFGKKKKEEITFGEGKEVSMYQCGKIKGLCILW